MGVLQSVSRDISREPIEARSDFVPFGDGLLDHEDAVGCLERWMAQGLRGVLVTLIGVEGGAPRQVGAQMAVCEDGRYAGYLSGGCLEQAVVLEALSVLQSGRNRTVRYGKNSPYLDIRLPCGSGLDVYFDRSVTRDGLRDLVVQRRRRLPVVLRTDLASGRSDVVSAGAGRPLRSSRRMDDTFERVYPPALKLVLAGGGPGLLAIATLAQAVGVELRIAATDEATRRSLRSGTQGLFIDSNPLVDTLRNLDFASAAVLVFHDHHNELDALEAVLGTDSFYVGALGNHAVHRERVRVLAERGVAQRDLERIRAPVGSIAGAKSGATLAVGVLTELMAEAKAQNLVA